jgi:hypothetical protein
MKARLILAGLLLLVTSLACAQLPGTFNPAMMGQAALACTANTDNGTDNDVVALWHLDDLNDSGFDKRNLTLNGAASISTAQSKFGGKSLAVGTQADFATITQNQNLIPANTDFTIEGWAYFGGTGPPAGNLYSWIGDNNTTWLAGANGSAHFYNIAAGGTVQSPWANFVPQAQQWIHFAYVRQGNIGYIYINGQMLPGANTATGLTVIGNTTTAFWIGKGHTSYQMPAGSFVDEVRISSVARYPNGTSFTPPTLPFCDPKLPVETCVANDQGGGSDTNVVSLYHFNGTGTDSSLSQRDGTLSGAAASFTRATAKFGTHSLAVTAAGSTFNFAPAPAFGTTDDFTVEFWANVGAFSGANPMFFGSSTPQVQLYTTSTTTLAFYWGGSLSFSGPTLPANNTWNHYALVRQNQQLTMYVNGTQFGNTQANSIDLFNGTFCFGTGGTCPNSSWALAGFLDEARISNMARYTSNFTPQTGPWCDPKPLPIAASYRYWRWNFTNWGTSIYIAEVTLNIAGTNQIPQFTSASPVGNVSVSGPAWHPSFPAWYAVDRNSGTWAYQATAPSAGPITIMIDFGPGVTVRPDSYSIQASSAANVSPTAWTLQASENGNFWVTIDAQNISNVWPAAEIKTFPITWPQ